MKSDESIQAVMTKVNDMHQKRRDFISHAHNLRMQEDGNTLHTKAERFLLSKFGSNSMEHKKFSDILFSLPLIVIKNVKNRIEASIEWCAEGLRSCKAVFNVYLEEMTEEQQVISKTSTSQCTLDMCKVFIVHGHDGALQQAVARLIERQGINAIILAEQVNRGRTVIEKFEDYADVGGAICLFTSDDFGRAKKDADAKPRARQNVVLETGYFMGRLGRDHVVLLADNGIEMPSDLSGVVYTNTGNWQVELLKELREMGYSVDLNKLL